MKLFYFGKDGGPDSTVWGFWLVEIKSLFSIALLCFEDGSREAFHSHAFNSVSWVLKGKLEERTMLNNIKTRYGTIESGDGVQCYGLHFYPTSWRPVFTSRDRMHKVSSKGRTWVLTFRGSWTDTWKEFSPTKKMFSILTSGRKVINEYTPPDSN